MPGYVALPLLLVGLQAEPAVVSAVEPTRPELLSTRSEARCGSDKLVLDRLGAGVPASAEPTLTLGGKALALPAAIRSFLSAERTAYRISAVCDANRTFQLRLYRVSGLATGAHDFAQYSFNVHSDGRITDERSDKTTAEGFFFR